MKIGAAATRELLLTEDLVDAQTAKELGIIQHVVPVAELDERVMALGPCMHDAASRPS